jgi:pseudouridine-5'-phosphate glycosidase
VVGSYREREREVGKQPLVDITSSLISHHLPFPRSTGVEKEEDDQE